MDLDRCLQSIYVAHQQQLQQHHEQQHEQQQEQQQQHEQQQQKPQQQQQQKPQQHQQQQQQLLDENEWTICSKCNKEIPRHLLFVHQVNCDSPLTYNNSSNNCRDTDKPALLYICDVCERVCPDRSSLCKHDEAHLQDAGDGGGGGGKQTVEFNCTACGMIFLSSQELRDHVDRHRTVNVLNTVCPICGRLFPQLAHYLRHVGSHQKVKPCLCGQIYASKRAFRDHQERCMPVIRDDPTAATVSKSYRCRLCLKVFGTVTSRWQHERIHTRGAESLQAASGRALKRQLVCELCKQTFATTGNYRAHMRSHTGERPYSCRLCPKSFTSLQGRWQHERIHKKKSLQDSGEVITL